MTGIQTIELLGVTQEELERFYGGLPEEFSYAFSFDYEGADELGADPISDILLVASWDHLGFKQSLTLDLHDLTAESLRNFLEAVPYRDVDFEPQLLLEFHEGELRVHLDSAVLKLGTQEQIDGLWESGDLTDGVSTRSTDDSTDEKEENHP